jgi:hypothetical protein
MYDDSESMRLRLEAALKGLARQEAADMHFDAKLLTEMRYHVTYFREQGVTVQVLKPDGAVGLSTCGDGPYR